MKLILKWIVCFAVLFLAYKLFPENVTASCGAFSIFIAASVLWLTNMIIRPVLQLLCIPFTLLTLGLFSIIVNAIVVCITDAFVPGFNINGFWFCVLIALAVSAANFIFAITKTKGIKE